MALPVDPSAQDRVKRRLEALLYQRLLGQRDPAQTAVIEGGEGSDSFTVLSRSREITGKVIDEKQSRPAA